MLPMSTLAAMLACVGVVCADWIWWRCRDTFLAFYQVITTGFAARPLPLFYVLLIKVIVGENAKGPRIVHVYLFAFEIARRASMLQLQRLFGIGLPFWSC